MELPRRPLATLEARLIARIGVVRAGSLWREPARRMARCLLRAVWVVIPAAAQRGAAGVVVVVLVAVQFARLLQGRLA
jgi:hypothetical protein